PILPMTDASSTLVSSFVARSGFGPPHTVDFHYNSSSQGYYYYILDFGDGNAGDLGAPPGLTDIGYFGSHTYSASGTYTVRLSRRDGRCIDTGRPASCPATAIGT